MTDLIPLEKIASQIILIRGQKVILDRDLAKLYGVETGRLNEQVTRNLGRFPSDFMFRLSLNETKNLISQNAISSWGGTRKQPRAFTEHGVAMLSSVLKSKKAVEINILIIRAFVRMRELLYSDKELALRIEKMEKNLEFQGKSIAAIVQAVNDLMNKPKTKPKKIGFEIKG